MLWMGRGTPDRSWNPRYYRNGEVVQGQPEQYGPDLTHDFLVDFMRRHRDRPFFVYYSAVLTHGPFVRTPDSKDETDSIPDMVAYLDKQIAPQILGRAGRPRDWVYGQVGREYFIADKRHKLCGDGRLVDITDSPIAEKAIDASDSEAEAADVDGARAGALVMASAGKFREVTTLDDALEVLNQQGVLSSKSYSVTISIGLNSVTPFIT